MSLIISPAPPTSISGKFSHGPANSLRSDASDARDDLREEARLEVAVPRRCTCKCKKFNAENLLCQPPGLEVCVCSSDIGDRSRSFFILFNDHQFEFLANYCSWLIKCSPQILSPCILQDSRRFVFSLPNSGRRHDLQFFSCGELFLEFHVHLFLRNNRY